MCQPACTHSFVIRTTLIRPPYYEGLGGQNGLLAPSSTAESAWLLCATCQSISDVCAVDDSGAPLLALLLQESQQVESAHLRSACKREITVLQPIFTAVGDEQYALCGTLVRAHVMSKHGIWHERLREGLTTSISTQISSMQQTCNRCEHDLSKHTAR